METNSIEWDDFISGIVTQFNPGELISHGYLKTVFRINDIDIESFENTDEFLKEYQDQQFQYMGLVDKMRSDLLLNENYYLENDRGNGYKLLPPKDQQAFAYGLAVREIRKSLKQASQIMTHVRLEGIDNEAKALGSALASKLSLISQMFNTLRH